MFRGKESSNRIELSQLVQDLLNFGFLGSLQLWGWVDGVGGGWGYPNTCAHAHACTHMHARTHARGKHDNFMHMAASIGFLGNPWEFPMMSYAHAHVCMCMCIGGTLSPPPTHIHQPPPPRGDPRNQSKFNSTLNNQDISILFENLKSVETFLPMGWCMVWWVGGWVGRLMGGVRSKH